MTDIIIVLILALIVGLAAGYIYKAKKSGKTCIGCPHAGQCGSAGHNGSCSGQCGSCGGCGDHAKPSADAAKSE